MYSAVNVGHPLVVRNADAATSNFTVKSTLGSCHELVCHSCMHLADVSPNVLVAYCTVLYCVGKKLCTCKLAHAIDACRHIMHSPTASLKGQVQEHREHVACVLRVIYLSLHAVGHQAESTGNAEHTSCPVHFPQPCFAVLSPFADLTKTAGAQPHVCGHPKSCMLLLSQLA